ncbi:MAG: hypothetical protein KGJ37_03905 [Verrucomicrobiota bacterium]|nr:hypothetical protein [Verrucomicrobiota bacterium]
MKWKACFLLFVAPTLALAISNRSSRQDVITELGRPRGQVQRGDEEILFFDQGQVRLVDGRVTFSDLMSPGDAARLQAEREANDARAMEERRQRIAQGEALKARMLAEPAFVSAPADYQLAFWKNFRLRYPEVSCDDEYSLALARYERQSAEQENAQRIADLEARVADTEARAIRAEREARSAIFSGIPPLIGDHRFSHHRERRDQAPVPPKIIRTFNLPPVNNIAPPLKNPAGPTPNPFFPLVWEMQQPQSR